MNEPVATPLHGSHVHHVPGAERGHPVRSDRHEVTVLLRPAPRPDTDPLVVKARAAHRQTVGKGAPLTREELEALNAPLPAHVEVVRGFAAHHGLEVVEVSRLRSDVVLAGGWGALEAAFGVRAHHFRTGEGTYVGHEGAVSLPAEVAEVVEAVLGLENRPIHRPDTMTLVPAGVDALFVERLADFYHFPCEVDASDRGIALLELGGGFHPSDMEDFFRTRVRPGISVLSVFGADGNPGVNAPLDRETLKEMIREQKAQAEASGDPPPEPRPPEVMEACMNTLEVTLDMQIAGALGGGAGLAVYFVPQGADALRRGIYAALGEPVGRPPTLESGDPPGLPSALSVSWGASEEQFGAMRMRAIDRAMRDANALGVPVCCSSGDRGATGGEPSSSTCQAHFPASSPFALAVGGTELVLQGGSLVYEIVWNEASHDRGLPLATGGGMSGFFPEPPYQAHIPKPPPQPSWIADGSADFRGRWLPDVAASAGYHLSIQVFAGGEECMAGGTSAATPIWAALLTVLAASLERTLGYPHAALYGAGGPGCFRSVAAGNNRVPDHAAPGYDSSAGWDPCTGHGTPIGLGLLEFLRRGG